MTPWKKRWTQLGQNWMGFLALVLDPLVLFLLVAAILLGVVVVTQRDPVVVAVLTIILGVASGLLGGVVSQKWSALTEEKVICARGRLAVRGLKLLLGNITALERRVREYLERHAASNGTPTLTPAVTQTCLEEIIERCVVLQEEALSSIENWTDIVPEADIKTQIGVITQLRLKLAAQSAQVADLTAKLEETKGRSRPEILHLEKTLADVLADTQKTKYDLIRASEVVSRVRDYPIIPVGVVTDDLIVGSPLLSDELIGLMGRSPRQPGSVVDKEASDNASGPTPDVLD